MAHWIIIPDVPPSLNVWQRMHWRKRGRLTRRFGDLLVACGARDVPEATGQKRKVSIIEYRKRMLDKDNLYGGVKPLVDAIKRLGLVVDDNEAWCELVVEQARALGVPQTVIKVEEWTCRTS